MLWAIWRLEIGGPPQTRASLKGSAPIRMGEKGTETGERGLCDEQIDYVEPDDAGWVLRWSGELGAGLAPVCMGRGVGADVNRAVARGGHAFVRAGDV